MVFKKCVFFRFFMSLFVLIPLFSAVSTDALAAGGGKKGQALEWEPPTHIQMIPMMVPVGHTNASVTFYIEATKPRRVEGICKRLPRLRDAVLQILSRKPIPVKNRRIITKGVNRQLLGPINVAVDYPYIKKLYITPRPVRLGSGKIENKPFAIIDGCQNILRSALARKEAMKAAQEK